MKSVSAQTFFTDDEKDRIRQAVARAEGRTSGEIVPMVVDSSYDYPRAEILGAALLSVATAATGAWALGLTSPLAFAAVQLGVYWPFRKLIAAFPALKRRLISAAEIDEEIRERALLAFLEHRLYRTRDATGVLILLSLFERRVYVLADEGINQKVAPDTWNALVAELSQGLHSGQACEALCRTIDKIATILEDHFPPRSDDRDELPNLILH